MITFAARMGVTSPGGQGGRSTGYDDKLGLIEKAIQSFQQWTERMDDRLTRLEADVFTNKSKLRDNHDILQSIGSKLEVLEVREQRSDRVLSAVERFLEVNSTNPRLRTELNSDLQRGMLIRSSDPTGVGVAVQEQSSIGLASPSVRVQRNTEKLAASENSEAAPEMSKTKRSTKRSKNPSNTDHGPDSEQSILPIENSLPRISRTHPNSNPEKAGYNCRICDRIFAKLDSYKDHQRFHIVGKLQCHLCSFETPCKSIIRKHFRSAHPGSQPAEFSCVEIELPDSGYKPFACDFQGCSNSYRERRYLTLHSKVHAQEKLECTAREPGSKMKHNKMGFKCPTCGKVFTRIYSYIQDQRFHILGKLKCHLCNYEVATRKSFMTHFKRVHPGCTPKELPRVHVPVPELSDKPFACSVPQCAKTYRLKAHLEAHLKYHAGESYKCDSCDFESFWMANLRRHSRKIHHKDRLEKESASSDSGSLERATEITLKKRNSSNRTSLRNKNISKLNRVTLLKTKLALSTTVKSTEAKPSGNESSEPDNDEAISKIPKTDRPNLKGFASASKKVKSSRRTTKNVKRTSSPNGSQSSRNNKLWNQTRKQKESEQVDASQSKPHPKIPSDTPKSMDMSPCAPAKDDNFGIEDVTQAHGCPLCSRTFSKISKLDRHFQKKH